jgi:hypothetical protein
MNLANMAPARTPWGGLGPEGIPALLLEGGGVSLQLSFDLAAPTPAAPPLPPPLPPLLPPLGSLAEPSMTEARASSRHGAELAALLVILQAETGLQPLAGQDAPPPVAEAWLPVSPLPDTIIPPPEATAFLPGPAFTAMDALGAYARPPAPDWLIL